MIDFRLRNEQIVAARGGPDHGGHPARRRARVRQPPRPGRCARPPCSRRRVRRRGAGRARADRRRLGVRDRGRSAGTRPTGGPALVRRRALAPSNAGAARLAIARGAAPRARGRAHGREPAARVRRPLSRRHPRHQRRSGGVRRAAARPRRDGRAARLAAPGRRRPRPSVCCWPASRTTPTIRSAPRRRRQRDRGRAAPGRPADARRRPAGPRGVPGLAGRTILHAGPPIDWERMCGPVQGAVIGAILFEGWATTPEAARSARCDRATSTSRRATTTARSGRWPASSRPSMPVVVVENAPRGQPRIRDPERGARPRAPRSGRTTQPVLDRLRWIAADPRPGARPRARSAAGPSTCSA